MQSKEKTPARETKKKPKGIVPDVDVKNKYLSISSNLPQKSVDHSDQTKSIKKAYQDSLTKAVQERKKSPVKKDRTIETELPSPQPKVKKGYQNLSPVSRKTA